MVLLTLQWLGPALNLVGAWMVAHGAVRRGYLVFLPANACVAAVSAASHLWGLVALEVAYTIVNVIGIRNQKLPW